MYENKKLNDIVKEFKFLKIENLTQNKYVWFNKIKHNVLRVIKGAKS